MAGAISRGLSLSDFNDLTIGQIVDYCITYNESDQNQEEKVIKATQEDYDNF